jgi:RNA polymerase sigma-70 factor (ECF subfamily)
MQAGTVLGNLAGVFQSHTGARPEEAAIIAELQAGSEEAFASLIAQYSPSIYALIARTIPNISDAADVTQDVFIKVYRGIQGFHGESSLRTWIYRIALHEASNGRRWWCRHKRNEVTIEQELGEDLDGEHLMLKDTLVDRQESPFELAAHAELRARVEEELRKVPEPYRTTVILRDIEGFGYEEIAEILNANLGTVKSRLMRGRAHLKARLAPLVQGSVPQGSTVLQRSTERPVRSSLPSSSSMDTHTTVNQLKEAK